MEMPTKLSTFDEFLSSESDDKVLSDGAAALTLSDDSATRRTPRALEDMARRAAWGEVLELSNALLMDDEFRLTRSSIENDPMHGMDLTLHCGIYRMIAFLQTRRYIRAGRELEDLQQYLTSGRAPFSLLTLALEVSARKNDVKVIDQAFNLKERLLMGELQEEDSAKPVDGYSTCDRKILYLLSLIVGYSLRMQRHDAALDAVRELADLTGNKDSVVMLSFVRVLLNMFDTDSASEILRVVEDTPGADRASVELHHGLIVAAKASSPADFEEAVSHFRCVLDLDGSNAVAINNLAICLLHVGKLQEAIDTLEGALRRNPSSALDEGLVFNLCTLYDLACPDESKDKKLALRRLAAKFGRQGFNLDVISIPS